MRELPLSPVLYILSFTDCCRSVPSSYISGLQSFTNFKMERLAEQDRLPSQAFSTHYNNQSLYIKALFNQLPHDLVLGTSSRSVLMHPPTTVSYHVARQGPFLLQPAPRTLDGVECSDAADIVYLVFGADDDGEGEGETDRLGIVLVACQDGRVDVCLDVDKVEARWDTKSVSG
jgi:nucleoporin NUP82